MYQVASHRSLGMNGPTGQVSEASRFDGRGPDAKAATLGKVGTPRHSLSEYSIEAAEPPSRPMIAASNLNLGPGVIQRMTTSGEDEMEDVSSFDDHLDFMGAKQQGMVSTAQGKNYAGPVSMKGHRTEQVQRHMANLVLNRLTKAQKTASKQVPVEVQTSSVGGTILVNSNNRSSDEALAAGLDGSSLHDYIMHADALKPAMDQDKARPVRYQSKLKKAFDGNRKWQQDGALGEDPADVTRAKALLEAMKSQKTGTFDLDDSEQIETELAKWKKQETRPKVSVLKHKTKSAIKDEHAERVQSDFRKEHLQEFETDAESTAPTGPKTTCFGCQVYHDVNHPTRGPHDRFNLSGAYFQGSSPVSSKAEKKRALKLVKSRPASGSVSQTGYLRNSDYPDSESDTEGNIAYPQPKGFSVAFGEKNPKKRKWSVGPGEGMKMEFNATWKRPQVEKRVEREKKKRKLK